MIEHWFTTPIYYNTTSNFEELQEEIGACYSKLKLSKHSNFGEQNHSLSDPTFSQNLINDYNLNVLKTEIINQVTHYTQSFTNINFKIDIVECWLTNTAPKEHTVVHSHGHFDISGVYYFKTNKNDGNIYFLNPNTSLMTSHFLASNDYVEYPPSEGMFILFPGWLYHGVRSNDTDNNRISISFNIKLTKVNSNKDEI